MIKSNVKYGLRIQLTFKKILKKKHNEMLVNAVEEFIQNGSNYQLYSIKGVINLLVVVPISIFRHTLKIKYVVLM